MSTSFNNLQAVPIDAALPAQSTSVAGKALISNGTNVGWNTILAMIGDNPGQTQSSVVASAVLPSQNGQQGKFLTVNQSGSIEWDNIAFPPNGGVTSLVISGVSYKGDVTLNTVPNANTAGNVTGVVAVANGGTGATTAPQALANIGAAAVNHTHSIYALIDSPTLTGVPKSVTPPIGDQSTAIATTQFVSQTVNGSSLAYNQTWQALTNQLQTTYTNGTGKAIVVNVIAQGSNGSMCSVAGNVNGNVIVQQSTSVFDGTSIVGVPVTVSMVVPAGMSYSVSNASGTNSLVAWMELR